jgi:hypothetical protein
MKPKTKMNRRVWLLVTFLTLLVLPGAVVLVNHSMRTNDMRAGWWPRQYWHVGNSSFR